MINEQMTLEDLKTKFSKIRLDIVDEKEQKKAENELIEQASKHYSQNLGIDLATVTRIIEKDILPKPIRKKDSIETITSKTNQMAAAIRMITPKVVGLEQRENNQKQMMSHLQERVENSNYIVNALDKRVALLNTVVTQLLKVNIEARENYYRIPSISYLFKKFIGLFKKEKTDERAK